ncbi:MAG: ATP-dependent ligase [Naasia sp.]|nr:ATP-dependent ligase [Naasia sp.]
MRTPIPLPLEPMLAKSAPELPVSTDARSWGYEPKWDGFRSIAYFDGDDVELGSRGSKTLTRYFPELLAALKEQLPGPCVLDGEIVVRRGAPGAERLDWEALSQRIHPADSRVRTLAEATPASFIAFDLLAEGDRSLLQEPLSVRRQALERLLVCARAPLHLTRITADPEVGRRWFTEFEGAGLDGVVAKDTGSVYSPGKRTMVKVKHARTADVVLTGYRVHKSGSGVGSLLVGLYGSDKVLRNVGGISAFSDVRRQELVKELDPIVQRDENGDYLRGEGDRNRFSANKDTSFVMLQPAVVAEVRYDQMEGDRFRHTVQFVRWRPDRDPVSCTFEQLETPLAYDLERVLE